MKHKKPHYDPGEIIENAERNKIMTQKFISERLPAEPSKESDEFLEIAKSVNFERNQLPQIKLPKTNESEMTSQSML